MVMSKKSGSQRKSEAKFSIEIERISFVKIRTKAKIHLELQKHQVVVNAYSEEWLLKDFDRVYHKEIVAVGSPLKNGTWVEILSMKQSSLGWGLPLKRQQRSNQAGSK